STIGGGLDEVAVGAAPDGRVRRAGAGRKPLEAADPRLIEDLERIVTPTQRGDPEQPLRWTIKSLRQIARALHDLGHGISHTSVGAVLRACGYSLQANRKTREGSHHPDRNAQFEYLNQTVDAALAEGQPAISVDAKKPAISVDAKGIGRRLQECGSNLALGAISPAHLEPANTVEGIVARRASYKGRIGAGRIAVLFSDTAPRWFCP